jgi:hypothetical protein
MQNMAQQSPGMARLPFRGSVEPFSSRAAARRERVSPILAKLISRKHDFSKCQNPQFEKSFRSIDRDRAIF